VQRPHVVIPWCRGPPRFLPNGDRTVKVAPQNTLWRHSFVAIATKASIDFEVKTSKHVYDALYKNTRSQLHETGIGN